MEVLALVPAAAALYVVHAHNDRVLAAVHHAGFQRVSVAAVALTPRAVTALKLSANLKLVCASVLLRRCAVAHCCQAGGTPRDEKGCTGQQLRHQAYGWAHVA